MNNRYSRRYRYSGSVIGVLAFVAFVILFQLLIVAFGVGVIVALFSIPITFNWSVVWWLLFGIAVSFSLAVLFGD